MASHELKADPVAGSEAETMEELCLLVCTHEYFTCSLVYMQDHLFRYDTSHAGLSPPL